MTTIVLKNRNSGKPVFTSTNADNTVAKCIALAHKQGIPLTDLDLSGQDISHGNFVGFVLKNADLRKAKMDGANFFGADLSGANMSGKDTSAEFANFEGAKLHRVNGSWGNFKGAWFKDAMSMEGRFDFANFDNGNLSNFMSRGASFKNISIEGTILDDTDVRIGYKCKRIPVPSVCDGPFQHCVGCKSWK